MLTYCMLLNTLARVDWESLVPRNEKENVDNVIQLGVTYYSTFRDKIVMLSHSYLHCSNQFKKNKKHTTINYKQSYSFNNLTLCILSTIKLTYKCVNYVNVSYVIRMS